MNDENHIADDAKAEPTAFEAWWNRYSDDPQISLPHHRLIAKSAWNAGRQLAPSRESES